MLISTCTEAQAVALIDSTGLMIERLWQEPVYNSNGRNTIENV
jgi:hypothetical protein